MMAGVGMAHKLLKKKKEKDNTNLWRPSNSITTNLGRFGHELFWPMFGVGRFGLNRWVVSALGRFGPESFRPNFNRDVLSLICCPSDRSLYSSRWAMIFEHILCVWVTYTGSVYSLDQITWTIVPWIGPNNISWTKWGVFLGPGNDYRLNDAFCL